MLKLFRKKSRSPHAELLDLLGDYELPSFPEVVMSVLGLLRDSESSTAAIANRLEMDPGMHVKVLKTVNSASFGLSTRVNSLHHAINLLGRARLESIVVSIAVRASMPRIRTGSFDTPEFWRSAARRASLARMLSHYLHPATQAEAFTSGLLQDMGVPVLVAVKGEPYCGVYNGWRAGVHERLDRIERETFGFDHPHVGGLIAEEWELPAYLVRAIYGHHDPEGGEPGEAAVRLVARLRDAAVDETAREIVEFCRLEMGIAAAGLEKDIARAIENAAEFYDLLT